MPVPDLRGLTDTADAGQLARRPNPWIDSLLPDQHAEGRVPTTAMLGNVLDQFPLKPTNAAVALRRMFTVTRYCHVIRLFVLSVPRMRAVEKKQLAEHLRRFHCIVDRRTSA